MQMNSIIGNSNFRDKNINTSFSAHRQTQRLDSKAEIYLIRKQTLAEIPRKAIYGNVQSQKRQQ